MPFSPSLDIRLCDSTLRDGSHPKMHRFTADEVQQVVIALDAAGVPVIEVTHGDGLGGSSINYGRSLVDERILIETAALAANNARIAVLMLPGVAVKSDILAARDLGASIVRIATHCTEADISIQHFGFARDEGLETVGFLMMAHTIAPEALAAQGRIMADAGCQCVYVVDSAGAMIPSEVRLRVEALRAELGDDAQVGFHGHENLALGVGNSLAAIEAGAVQIDGSTRRFGAGAGNTPLEAMAAVLERMGLRSGIDTAALIDAAEDVVRRVMPDECRLDRLALLLGYTGVYSSFLKHADRQAERYGVSAADILVRAAERRLVGGQEDQLIDIAIELRNAALAAAS